MWIVKHVPIILRHLTKWLYRARPRHKATIALLCSIRPASTTALRNDSPAHRLRSGASFHRPSTTFPEPTNGFFHTIGSSLPSLRDWIFSSNPSTAHSVSETWKGSSQPRHSPFCCLSTAPSSEPRDEVLRFFHCNPGTRRRHLGVFVPLSNLSTEHPRTNWFQPCRKRLRTLLGVGGPGLTPVCVTLR